MLHPTELPKHPAGNGFYVDSGNKRHPVIHSIAVSQEEQAELQARIAEDLLRVLTSRKG